jgi:TatD DNase family protein
MPANSMRLIDTHSHLYSSQFDTDRPAAVARARAHLSAILLPNIDANSVEPMLALCQDAPGFCFPMLGLHPCYVPEDYARILSDFETRFAAPDHPFVAVGECGLDLYWDKTTLPRQQAALRTQLEWAKDLGLPIVLHSREAIAETLELVAQAQDGRLRGVFHCWSDPLDYAQRAIDLGFYLGFGGPLTYRKDHLPAVAQAVPLDWIVLETDSPYLAPSPHRRQRNESAYTRLVAERLADLRGQSYADITAATTHNALRLFDRLPASLAQ